MSQYPSLPLFGKRGEFWQRDLDGQVNRANCLQLVAAMVITWNAAYLSAAVENLKSQGVAVTDEQLAHILPLVSEHINFLGRYEFDAGALSVQTNVSSLHLRSMDRIAEQIGLGI